MSLSLDGLASGLDTTAMIDALMDVQAIPRNLLKAKADDKEVVISHLQTLNTSLQDLLTKATAAKKADALAAYSATSSSDAVSVTASAGASAARMDIVVDRVATAHTVVTAALTEWPEQPPTLTLVDAEGNQTEIVASGTSLTEVAAAINKAGVPVTAQVVSAGVDANGDPLHRLQLVATATGTAGAFQIYRGDAAAVDAGTATDLATEAGAAVVTQAQDAQVRLWAGTAAEQVVTSSSNTFDELMPGIDVTVSKATTEPVTVSVSADTAASAKTAKSFVDAIAAILKRIDEGSKATVAGSTGETTTLGVYTGDSTVRALRRSLGEAVQHPVGGVSPSSIGVSVDRYGVLTFDAEKFEAALADDPALVEGVFTGIAERVETVATQYSDRYDGLLTSRITGQESEVDALEDQIERWDLRLEQRRATLERTYASLETMLSQMQSQQQYLSSQLSALPSYGKGNNR
ncbi:flagellar filament capping protein FliD [Microbacterium sp. Marseille-Q6965]|uniref:flagellar filament capping protein FliD n=1 Tax=Microbacterium sp. Marseille-Q6965 TaxID=2965072 RepID=UPI0021B77E72|nr:flagellar filament capping protein FliD [Microbacterium sp. Marseille-Q6965]